MALRAGFGDPITNYDRECAMTREPVAYRVNYMVAEDVFGSVRVKVYLSSA